VAVAGQLRGLAVNCSAVRLQVINLAGDPYSPYYPGERLRDVSEGLGVRVWGCRVTCRVCNRQQKLFQSRELHAAATAW
jgi:hypothetical protein